MLPSVTMKPSDALQQHVDGAQVGDEQIGVDVQTLFESLRTDEQKRPIGAIFAQTFAHLGVHHFTIFTSKPPVVRTDGIGDMKEPSTVETSVGFD